MPALFAYVLCVVICLAINDCPLAMTYIMPDVRR